MYKRQITNPHGFSIEWLKLPKGQSVSRHRLAEKQVMMGHAGAVEVVLNAPGHEVPLAVAAKDVLSIPANAWRTIRNTGNVDAEVLLITTGDGRKRPEWAAEVVQAAADRGRTVDASGFVAPKNLVPTYALGKR